MFGLGRGYRDIGPFTIHTAAIIRGFSPVQSSSVQFSSVQLSSWSIYIYIIFN